MNKFDSSYEYGEEELERIDRQYKKLQRIRAEFDAAVAQESPQGFDVWCAEDTPAFKTWQRVAWFADEPKTRRYLTDEIELHEVGQWINDNTLVAYGRKPADGSTRRQLRWYSIRPAGSPAPE